MCIADSDFRGVHHEFVGGVEERLCVHGICNDAVFAVAVGPCGGLVTGTRILKRDVNGVAALGFYHGQNRFWLTPNFDYLHCGVCATRGIYRHEGHVVLGILGAQCFERVGGVQGIRSRAVAEVPSRRSRSLYGGVVENRLHWGAGARWQIKVGRYLRVNGVFDRHCSCTTQVG